MSLHIYRASDQNATRHRVDFGPPLGARWFTYPKHKLFWTQCCEQRRYAKNLIIHCYYDATYFFCKTGTGCKDPFFIAAKRRREFRNRSAGNKAAWARRESASVSNRRAVSGTPG